MAFIIRLELDCACNLVGTHTSCANVNRFYIAVVFNDFYFVVDLLLDCCGSVEFDYQVFILIVR